MPPALQFWYPVLVLIAEGSGLRMLMAAPDRELEPKKLETFEMGNGSGLRAFYELADFLTVLDEVSCLKISNLARQLKFKPEIADDHHVISHLTRSLWFWSIFVGSTRSSRRLINDRRNKAQAEKQLESMVYRLTQERGR